MAEVRLAGWYQFQQLDRLIRDLSPVLSLRAAEMTTIDLTGLCFLGPTSLAVLVAALKRIDDRELWAKEAQYCSRGLR